MMLLLLLTTILGFFSVGVGAAGYCDTTTCSRSNGWLVCTPGYWYGNYCNSCTSNSDCSWGYSPASYCNTATGYCVYCNYDSHCAAGYFCASYYSIPTCTKFPNPTEEPTLYPTPKPSTPSPTTLMPTMTEGDPTAVPTLKPSSLPTANPTTSKPTANPTLEPSPAPSSQQPSMNPSQFPSFEPTLWPSASSISVQLLDLTASSAFANKAWITLATSDDGTVCVAAPMIGQAVISSNRGLTWNAVGPSRQWTSLAVSGDGKVILGADTMAKITVISSDMGRTWSTFRYGAAWSAVALSSDASTAVVAAPGPGKTNFFIATKIVGVWHFINQTNAGNQTSGSMWTNVVMSSDGSIIAACATYAAGGAMGLGTSGIWLFRDRSWSAMFNDRENAKRWSNIAISSAGNVIAAVDNGFGSATGSMWVSQNTGEIWFLIVAAAALNQFWVGVSVSGDGSTIVGCAGDGDIVSSSDGGESWTSLTAPTGNNAQFHKRKYSALATAKVGIQGYAAIYEGNIIGVANAPSSAPTFASPTPPPTTISLQATAAVATAGAIVGATGAAVGLGVSHVAAAGAGSIQTLSSLGFKMTSVGSNSIFSSSSRQADTKKFAYTSLSQTLFFLTGIKIWFKIPHDIMTGAAKNMIVAAVENDEEQEQEQGEENQGGGEEDGGGKREKKAQNKGEQEGTDDKKKKKKRRKRKVEEEEAEEAAKKEAASKKGAPGDAAGVSSDTAGGAKAPPASAGNPSEIELMEVKGNKVMTKTALKSKGIERSSEASGLDLEEGDEDDDEEEDDDDDDDDDEEEGKKGKKDEPHVMQADRCCCLSIQIDKTKKDELREKNTKPFPLGFRAYQYGPLELWFNANYLFAFLQTISFGSFKAPVPPDDSDELFANLGFTSTAPNPEDQAAEEAEMKAKQDAEDEANAQWEREKSASCMPSCVPRPTPVVKAVPVPAVLVPPPMVHAPEPRPVVEQELSRV